MHRELKVDVEIVIEALLQIATGSEDQVDSRPGLRYAAIPKRAWMN